MSVLRTATVSASSILLVTACLGNDNPSSPDGGISIGSDATSTIPPDFDALPPPADFEGLSLSLVPQTPRPNFEFTLSIRAVDEDGRLYRNYNGIVQVEDSAGALQGITEDLQVTGGTLFVPLLFPEELEDVIITVTDQDDSSIVAELGPFNVEFEGDRADFGDVVINEINWFGPQVDIFGVPDVWIELRNVSDRELNLAQWTLEGAGIDGEDIALQSGTVVPPGGYAVVANYRIVDFIFVAFHGSVFGVPNAQFHADAIPLDLLPEEGKKLILRDVDNTLIDETPEPSGGWAAGNDRTTLTMERIGDLDTGYGDGSLASQWVTFNPSNPSTTHPNTIDDGSPGADNSDQDLASSLPFETSFETNEPKFERTGSAGELIINPPEGIEARTGFLILGTDSLVRNSFGSRELQSVECVEVDEGTTIELTVYATASTENGNEPDALGLRHAVAWFTDNRCQTLHSDDEGDRVDFNEGEYTEIVDDFLVPDGVTHAKFRIQPIKIPAGVDLDAWAADDFSARVQPSSGSPN
jgi:hypothetical protein